MSIRTTITLDEDVIERVRLESKTRGIPFRTAINDLLRMGLFASNKPRNEPPFCVKPIQLGLVRGVHKTSTLIEMGEGEAYR